MWQDLDKPPSVTFVKLVPIPAALACINTYSTIMALWAMTSHMGILLKTLRAHHNQTHCQQGSCSWACLCSSSVVLHWHMHLEHRKVDSLDPPPPLFAAAFGQIVPLASTIACDIPQFWHSVQAHDILYGHAVEHFSSFYYRSTFGKHFIEAIMHITYTSDSHPPSTIRKRITCVGKKQFTSNITIILK
jgi:hypothetical protein